MRSTASVPLALLLALYACGPDAPAELVTEAACPILAPTRLVAAPDGFEGAEDVWYGLHTFGDDILFTFDRFDDPDRQYWRLNRCTGDIEPYASLAPGLHEPYVIDTLNGRVLYGNDDDGRPYVIDRLDVPGADEARPVLGLPDEVQFYSPPHALFASFYVFWTSSSDELIVNAASVGALTYAKYTHLGDPDVPALRLSDQLVSAFYFDDTHSLAHEDSGEVHRINNVTGERELLLTGVRYLDYGFDGRTFIWQAIGDDHIEPVYLHDLNTGEALQIAVNDFAAMSWGRGDSPAHTGEWIYSDKPGAAAAAMIGPDGRFVAAVRLDTGETLAIPPHIEQRGSFAGYFRLLIAGSSGDVEALWEPLTGELHEWYRGQTERPFPLSRDAHLIEYFVYDPADASTGTLWRFDLATHETVQLLTKVRPFPFRVHETQYLVSESRGPLDGPPNGGPGTIVRELRDLALVDIGDGRVTPIVDRVSGAIGVPDQGILFLDALGPEPGLWAYPLPFSASRSGVSRGPE